MLWINGFGYIAWGKSIAGVASLDAIFHMFWWARDRYGRVQIWLLFCVIRRARNECHYSTINTCWSLDMSHTTREWKSLHSQWHNRVSIPQSPLALAGWKNSRSYVHMYLSGPRVHKCRKQHHIDVLWAYMEPSLPAFMSSTLISMIQKAQMVIFEN